MSFQSFLLEHRKREPCEDCGTTTSPTSFCVDCGSNYCDDCWMKAPPHKLGKVNRDGLPHEKINKEVATRLKEIFTPTSDPNTQRQLHQADRDTTWFGVCRGSSGRPELQDHGRYSRLVRDSWTRKYRERWPQLVSFVGQTGGGKSTLVKILIDYQERSEKVKLREGPDSASFRSPVAGSVNDQAPTSGDVHLYADPGTYFEQYPMLYADCEGLDGGERIPVGAQHQELLLAPPVRTQSPRKRSSSIIASNHKLPNKIRKAQKAAKRELRWATDPESCKREFAVRHLYPRLLYAFSDVVIFVLRNERTFESGALVPMLKWAYSSIEGVLGQPVKPHVIIVSNFTDPSINSPGWDVRTATRSLFDTYATAIHDNIDIRSHVQYWEGADIDVKSTYDLLLRYYSSVDVVRIPQKGRYGLVNDQIAKLHECIKRRCMEARDNRKRLRVMFNTEEFQTALSMGFDHFSTGLDEPFDFVELSCRLNPIPKDFGGNILRLALAIKDDAKFANASGRDIFKNLGHMVASCVMLDYTRHHIKGTPSRLLGHYEESYTRALVEFCEDRWPCCFENKYGRCTIPRRNHIKGHQNERGRILGDGAYKSTGDFTVEKYRDEWRATLDQNLQHIRKKMDKKTSGGFPIDEEQAATDLHRQLMEEFYSNMGNLDAYTNHSACFCCLRELPEHPLPCGHVLCTPCVNSFYAKKDNVSYKMDHCPLHPDQKWEWNIPIKPPLAGVRILSLDGGGIRGIVELEVLQVVQRELGGLPIKSFFDLIVGTSTGGLIALGLGVKEWSLNECTNKFTSMCDNAFTPREFHDIPIFNTLATLNHKSRYKTKPFEETLRKTFEEDLLFGGHCDTERYQRKVAVVSALNPGRRAAILTNYNRPQRESAPDYKFERPEKAEEELKVWEACRATSAATGYFKPFANVRSGASYIDGALFYNNPATVANQERKLLWPDASGQQPDILLSIGTGCPPEDPSPVGSWRRLAGMFQPALNRFDSMLDAQNAWELFYQDVQEGGKTSMANERYIRLNPELKSKIEMDDVRSLKDLRDSVRATLRLPKWIIDCGLVAKRLISSSFYFERDENRLDQETIRGQICCRFPDGSSELRTLGSYLVKLQRPSFSPEFIINQEWNDSPQSLVISREAITDMIQDSTFKIDSVEIHLSRGEKASITLKFSHGEEYPISGFPQTLVTEDPSTPVQSPVIGSKSVSPSIPNTILEEERKKSTESSIEELASWAHGLGKKNKKSTLSLRHKKRPSDPQMPPISKPQGVDQASTSSIDATMFNNTSLPKTQERDRFQQFDSRRLLSSNNLPADFSPLGTSTDQASGNQEIPPQVRTRGLFSRTVPSPSSPQARGPIRNGESASFSSHVQAQAQAQSFADDWGRHNPTVSNPPIYSYFSPDEITGSTEPAGNGFLELDAQQSSTSLPERSLEGLSEEEQVEIAIKESMKIAKESRYRYA